VNPARAGAARDLFAACGDAPVPSATSAFACTGRKVSRQALYVSFRHP
jgi:hypothetical protein